MCCIALVRHLLKGIWECSNNKQKGARLTHLSVVTSFKSDQYMTSPKLCTSRLKISLSLPIHLFFSFNCSPPAESYITRNGPPYCLLSVPFVPPSLHLPAGLSRVFCIRGFISVPMLVPLAPLKEPIHE